MALTSFSTESVPPAQRIDYWHSGVLRLLDAAPGLDAGMMFDARLTRLAGVGAELLDHAGSGLMARRDAARCRADGRDDISLTFVVMSSRANVVHGATKIAMHSGDMMIHDSTVPTELKRKKYRAISLFIPRAQVGGVCRDPRQLSGRLMRPHGIAGVLRAHLQATMDHAAHMQSRQHVMALDMAVQMALAALGDEAAVPVDAAMLAEGLYHAAKVYIAQDCTNLGLNPSAVVLHLGSSRSALYRAFAQHGESVAVCIWSARLAHAKRMLGTTRYGHLHINEIAFRSGFSDHSTFDRMFKRAYGMQPGDMQRMKPASGRAR